MWQDIRFALRQFAASKAFTITAAITLALGLAASGTLIMILLAEALFPEFL